MGDGIPDCGANLQLTFSRLYFYINIFFSLGGLFLSLCGETDRC